jgi:putative ATP-dependent endonuclease of the OLD family
LHLGDIPLELRDAGYTVNLKPGCSRYPLTDRYDESGSRNAECDCGDARILLRLDRLSIKNFRCFENFTLDVGGRSFFLISENGGGKSSLLSAIAMTLGRDRLPVRTDFRDVGVPLEITSTFSDFDSNEQAELSNAIDFTTPPQMQVGVIAKWDSNAEELDADLILPSKRRRPTRQERAAFGFIWLPAWRDLSRLTSFGARNSMLAQIVGGLPIGQSLQNSLNDIRDAIQALKSEPELLSLFDKMRAFLRSVLPPVLGQVYDLGSAALTDRELLSQLELLLSYDSPFIAPDRQSSGLAQLTVFSLAAEIASVTPTALFCIDEPEVSLHPQAQRALCGTLSAMPNQTLIATHSSNLLERVDPRTVIRLSKSSGQVTAVSPSSLSDKEATALARYSSTETAEGFFAKRIMFVEGPADRLAVLSLARRNNWSLDSMGLTVIALNGADVLGWYLKLFGPKGFQLPVCGLCDLDHVTQWASYLEDAGFGTNLSPRDMEIAGFFVCDSDLEDELIRALGEAIVLQAIQENGDTNAWTLFRQQPKYRTMNQSDQIREFLAKRKVGYAPLLVSKLSSTIPRPLQEVLAFAIR